jgi:hypothetical protein
VQDPRGLRDAYIFANDQKVFYRSFSQNAANLKDLQFETAVPLKTGTNIINIVTRVDNEIMARRTLVFHRESGPETAARQDEESTRTR